MAKVEMPAIVTSNTGSHQVDLQNVPRWTTYEVWCRFRHEVKGSEDSNSNQMNRLCSSLVSIPFQRKQL